MTRTEQQQSRYLASLVHFRVEDVLGLVCTGLSTEGEEDWDHPGRQACCQLLCDVQGFACSSDHTMP